MTLSFLVACERKPSYRFGDLIARQQGSFFEEEHCDLPCETLRVLRLWNKAGRDGGTVDTADLKSVGLDP